MSATLSLCGKFEALQSRTVMPVSKDVVVRCACGSNLQSPTNTATTIGDPMGNCKAVNINSSDGCLQTGSKSVSDPTPQARKPVERGGASPLRRILIGGGFHSRDSLLSTSSLLLALHYHYLHRRSLLLVLHYHYLHSSNRRQDSQWSGCHDFTITVPPSQAPKLLYRALHSPGSLNSWLVKPSGFGYAGAAGTGSAWSSTPGVTRRGAGIQVHKSSLTTRDHA